MNEHSKDRVLKNINNSKKEIIKLASDLIKFPSENPPGDMTDISAFIVEYLERFGLKCDIHEPVKGKTNILCHLGKKGKKQLVLNGHIDVVPVGDQSQWSYDPYSGDVKDGLLLGRGASDMKGGDAGIISTMRFLAEHEEILDGELVLTLVPDEETMGIHGTQWILEQGLIEPDACIIAEPTGISMIDVGQKGAFWGKVKVKGIPIHGSLSPYKGESAILRACKVMKKMFEITDVKITAPKDIADVIEKSKPLVEAIIGEEGVGIILSSPTLNIGLIKGGTKVNIVPDVCELDFDMRLPIGFTVSQASEKMNDILDEFGNQVDFELMTAINPNFTAPNAPIVNLTKQNMKTTLGIEPSIFVQWASSDARHFRSRDIDTIHYGPAIIEGIHGIDEKVKVEDIINATKVYSGTCIDYLS